MAQFVVIGRDFPDALDRRLAVRERHLALVEQLRVQGKLVFGAAIMSPEEKMIGSILLARFNDRAELDAWLAIEPYVTERVWDTVEVLPIRVGPTFVEQFAGLL